LSFIAIKKRLAASRFFDILQQIAIKITTDKMIKTHAGATPLRPLFCGELDQKLL
jgi:hypothetical protein